MLQGCRGRGDGQAAKAMPSQISHFHVIQFPCDPICGIQYPVVSIVSSNVPLLIILYYCCSFLLVLCTIVIIEEEGFIKEGLLQLILYLISIVTISTCLSGALVS